MAHIAEETITITLSQLVKTDDKPNTALTEELYSTLETVAQELVGSGVIVEIK